MVDEIPDHVLALAPTNILVLFKEWYVRSLNHRHSTDRDL